MRPALIFFILIHMLSLGATLSGCAPGSKTDDSTKQLEDFFANQPSQPGTVSVYLFREPSYKGLGRIHELRIDDQTIGELTSDNFYRIALWPGTYIFSVYLPEEDFLGMKSPAENSNTRIALRPTEAGSAFIYKHVDGSGLYRVESDKTPIITKLVTTRTLAANLSARETAQVKFLFDTRYDGPAKHGKAHGNGTLTWDDGSIFRGRFEYGRTTIDGKFFRSDGLIYLGPKSKGRPTGPGVLATDVGQILYAGKFNSETPHGIGMRSGEEGPEFCTYENGEDKTKTIWQITAEALETEDKQRKKQLQELTIPEDEQPYKDLPLIKISSDAILDVNGALAFPDLKLFQNPSKVGGNDKPPATREDQTKQQTTIENNVSEQDRYSAKYKEIKIKIQQQIEDQRSWCMEEFSLGRQQCVCAPFAVDFESWKGCIDH